MTIRLRPLDHPEPIGEWVLPKTPVFLYAERFKVLRRDLERYVNGEISGRSYLIAGHRGSGKTALVTRTIQDLRQALLEASVAINGPIKDLRRPLLVKLYGPSLVSALEPTKDEVLARKYAARAAVLEAQAESETKAVQDAKAEAEAETRPKTKAKPGDDAGKAEAQAEPEVTKVTDPALMATQSALVQITIALYRALAAEMAEAYRFHASERAARRDGEALELAAQLALELDTATSPMVLRNFWRRVERLGWGVLWPLRSDHTVRRLGRPDQGLREVVAIATASQAFEICSGVVTDKETNTQSQSQASAVKAQGSSDLREIVGRLGTLGVGALSGAALWDKNAPGAVILGAAVWLLGTATLSWSFSRKRQSGQTSDYTFLRDRSVQTLDRDLPLVIRRVREAGLAPVFVIDELDKLDDPQKTIGDIITRLKHIVADNGFFCFLTDRSYFDHVERMLEDQAFPKEHTYFSMRRLLAYSPGEMKDYVADQLVLSEGAGVAETTARTTCILWLAHRARVNFARLIGDFADLTTDAASDDMTETVTRYAVRPDVRLAATLQMAIDQVLAEPDLAARMRGDAAFAQLANDAIYFISKCWEDGARDFDAGEAVLKAYLEKRLKAVVDDPEPPPLDPADLDILLEANVRLIGLLQDLEAFATRMEEQPDPEVAARAAIVPLDLTKSLLKLKPGTTDQFDFSADRHGRRLGPGRGRTDGAERDELVAIARETKDLLDGLEVSLSDLTGAGLLPPTLAWSAIEAARDLLAAWSPSPLPSREAANAFATLRALRAALQDNGDKLASGLRLAVQLMVDSDTTGSISPALRTLSRYLPLGPSVRAGWSAQQFAASHPDYPDLAALRLTSDPRDIRAWIAHTDLSAPPRFATSPSSAELWEIWRPRLLRHFDAKAARAAFDVGYRELVAACEGVLPSALLAQPLAGVSPYDWSQLALRVLGDRLNPKRDQPPLWAFVAALRALGFDKELLKRVSSRASLIGPKFDNEAADAEAFIKGAKSARQGVLVIVGDGEDPATLIPSGLRPTLYIGHSELAETVLGMDWLQSQNAFAGVIGENEQAP